MSFTLILAGMYGECTLIMRLWSIRLDYDAAQVGYVHTIKKLSIILKKNHMNGSKVFAKYVLQVKLHATLDLGRKSLSQIYADR